MWGPALRVGGPAGAHWTQVCAVEWGCRGRKGCNLEKDMVCIGHKNEVGVGALGTHPPELYHSMLLGFLYTWQQTSEGQLCRLHLAF